MKKSSINYVGLIPALALFLVACGGSVDSGDEGLPGGSTSSSDATLSDLRVDGNTVSGFSKNKFDYTYEVPSTATSIPSLSYTTSNLMATAEVSQAGDIYGTAYVYVLSQDSANSEVYTVDYVEEQVASGETVLYDLNRDQLSNVSITNQDLSTPNNGFTKNQVGPNETVLTIQSSELAYITIDVNANPANFDEVLLKLTTDDGGAKYVFVNRNFNWGNPSTFYSLTVSSTENLKAKFTLDNPLSVTIVANNTTFTRMEIVGVNY